MIHLNDSDSARGSHRDRHTHLGEGEIGREGLAHLLCHPSLDHVAFYFETPLMEQGFDAINVARLGDLACGRPLTPAPTTSWGSGADERGGSPRGRSFRHHDRRHVSSEVVSEGTGERTATISSAAPAGR